MQHRTINAIVITIFSDSLSKYAFVKLLTDSTVEHVKINTTLDKCPFKHMLRPNYMLQLDLIKTRKHWIIKDVVKFTQYATLSTFSSYERIAQLFHILDGHTYQNQEMGGLLHDIYALLSQKPVLDITPQWFESFLLTHQGFHVSTHNPTTSKSSNHL